MSEREAAYQLYITKRSGQAYVVRGVKFDGVDETGLLEAKGPGYAAFVRDGQFQEFFQKTDDLLDQARRQLEAAKGMPIIWHIAEPEAMEAMQKLLASKGFGDITFVNTPPEKP